MATVWRHIAQSVQGANHSATGTPCQDSCAVRVLNDADALVACIGDGAGYVRHADIGSRLACQSIVASAASYFETHRTFADLQTADILQWCETARSTIAEHAALCDQPVREYATTLGAALVSPRGSAFFQIGDGAMIVRKNGVLGVVFWPQSGEYINTTHFLTAEDYSAHVQFFATKSGFSDLALLTDGIERLALKFDSLTPHPPFFQPLFQALRTTTNWEGLEEALRQFLLSDSMREKTDDDKTLVLASNLTG